jgi:putative membrane-bound dehydrogenase-like protein
MAGRSLFCSLALFVFISTTSAADVEADIYRVGVAEVDITPAHPIRLNGFGFRRTESEGVNHPIHVRAISIRHKDDADPLVLMTTDVLGIPDTIRAELVKRLAGKVRPERLAVTATHTHCGPMLKGANPTLFGVPIPEEHQKHIDGYTAGFLDKLEAAAIAALKDPQPARLFWGVGSVGFAKNRRAANGPKDHDLPVLVIRDAKTNAVRAVYTTYACHCVTLSHNKLGGDWAGYAAEAIKNQFPGAVALVSIGCGADQNPDSGVTGDKVEVAQVQGRQVGDEVKRLLGGYLAPVRGKPSCTLKSIDLALADLPTHAGWEEKAKRTDAIGHHARVQLAKLDRKEALATKIDYPIQAWAFGDSLAMVHLPGEVVADYAVRLKTELDRSRVWLTAYANTNPCYIPSERVLKEGGYEGGGAMVYYDVPVPFAPGLEDKIVAEVKAHLGKSFLTRIDPAKTGGEQPKSPQQSRRMIQVDGKFAVDLVAAEPLVADPVAVAFGPDGRLWVAEMLDYPTGKSGGFEPGGRVRFLEDTDRDGTFDAATTFLDDLPFPTGVLPWRNGVLVTAAPDILYAEDTTGDGKADKVTKLFSGFGTDNYQARVNGLAYGLDGWVYGSCGLFGGNILSHKTGKTTALGDRDFRIKPDTGEIEPATGRTQQGRVRDDWDNWFGCDNSNLAWHYALADHYLRRNPHVAPPRLAVSVPTGPDANRLFPIHAPQLFQLSGPAGRTTGACGIGVYRDDRLGSAFTGNTFTCEPVNQLVHRRVLKPSGLTFTGVRAAEEQGREFLASSDGWFRPVQAVTGPDGGLWVVDMYRYVIEHPRWIPPADLAKLDVRAGAGLGRVYRVRPAVQPVQPIPNLTKLDGTGLVAALDTANGWQRDMATELLDWRADMTAIPSLKKLARESNRPETRLHALVALERLGASDADTVAARLHDSDSRVRRHAIRLAEPFLERHPDLGQAVAKVAVDTDPQVRVQVAYAMGRWNHPTAGAVLAALVAKPTEDPLLVAAVVSSLNRNNFRAFVERPEVRQLGGSPLLPKLIATAVGLGDDDVMAPLLRLVTTARDEKYEAWQFAALETVMDAWNRSKKEAKYPADVRDALTAARLTARDADAVDAVRVAAVRLMGRDADRLDGDLKHLASLLAAQSPVAVQAAAVAALGRIADPRAADVLLKGWNGYTPALQAQAIGVLLDRDTSLQKVFAAIAAGTIPSGAIPAGPRQGLLTHPDTKLRARAEKAFAGAIKADRQAVIDAYRKEWPKAADPARGKEVFKKSCASCHALDGVGHAVGPDLAMVVNKSGEYLLAEILDPNRNIDNRYLEYAADTADGRSLRGLLAAESTAAITLKQADGKEVVLLRSDLERLKSSGRSLMPEGLEKDVPPAAMADLVAYLGTAVRPPKTVAGNAPKVLRAADGQLVLRAANCEIHGGTITFESEFGNIGHWHGPADHVVWRVELAAAGEFDVYLDFACDAGSAGNAFALDGGERSLIGKVASTGAWSKYERAKLGTIKLRAGANRLTFRPDTQLLTGALLDLRTLYLVPKGQQPKVPPAVKADGPTIATAADLANYLLDDGVKAADREAAVAAHADKSADTIRAMAADLPPGKEEYRRIPWIWRVAVAAGKRNKAEELRAILDVSLPKAGEKLRDWQAVVIGGGIINGVSQLNVWPAPRVREVIGRDAALAARWAAALDASVKMADDPKVPTGTRYDALRMIPLLGWQKSGEQLAKYLAKGTNAELQMGAVSGCVDVDAAAATAALVAALPHLAGQNRKLALQGLLRTDSRTEALLDAVEAGKVARDALDAAAVRSLRESKSETVRTRAAKLFGGR